MIFMEIGMANFAITACLVKWDNLRSQINKYFARRLMALTCTVA